MVLGVWGAPRNGSRCRGRALRVVVANPRGTRGLPPPEAAGRGAGSGQQPLGGICNFRYVCRHGGLSGVYWIPVFESLEGRNFLRRDPAFDAKMAEVLCVYQEVAILRAVESNAVKACPGTANKAEPNVAFISYDEKPGIQAIANTAPDLPPVANEHPCVARDHEYNRHGTLSLLAGIDLLTGQVHACVRRCTIRATPCEAR